MPFFESSTGVLIKDSNFYEIGGDMNIHGAPPMVRHEALEFDSRGGPKDQLEGPGRNGRHGGAARILPHDNSPWPPIAGGPHTLYLPHNCPDSWAMSTLNSSLPLLSNPVPQPFPHPPAPTSMATSSAPLLLQPNSFLYSSSEPQPGFRFGLFGSEQEYAPDLRGPHAASCITCQYPSEPSSNTPEHANPPFAHSHPASASFPKSRRFQNMFEPNSDPRFEPFFYPPNVIDDGSQSRYSTDGHGFYSGPPNRAITYQQPQLELHYSTSSRSNYSFPGDQGAQGSEANVGLMGTPDFPWHCSPEGPRTNIHGSTFISGNVNHVQCNGETGALKGLQLLYRASAVDALHNSVERYPQPKCHPDTRKEMLDNLWNWTCGIEPLVESEDYGWTGDADSSFADNSASNILWLYGPAGAGKSAIVQSLCERLETEGCVAASFFFKRGDASRGNAKQLFSTIAYQLAVLLPELRGFISQSVENDPAIVNKSLSIQVQKLIVEPWQQINTSPCAVIIIDGLDECDGQKVQQEILWSICYAIHAMKLPIRFLIASRPESHIFEMFHAPPLDKLHRGVNIQQSFEDVRKYLWDEFTRIRREHPATLTRVSESWPVAEDLEHLVRNSSGYFIYASTVIKFIDDKNFCPSDRLDIIMGFAEPHLESPLAALDLLYTQILSDVPDRHRLLQILTVIAAKLYLGVHHIEQLLELKLGDVELALRGLHSVLEIPDTFHLPFINVHHASFLDFLNDPTRAGIFYINSQHRSDLAQQILKAFSYKYEDPFLNQSGPVAWYFGEEILTFIISVKPSPDLVSLLQLLNPDFLFSMLSRENSLSDIANAVLGWLEEILPRPQGLLELWEDYAFMLRCDEVWKSTREHLPFHEHKYGEILSKVPLQLLGILRACTITKGNYWFIHTSSLVRIHFLLDFSWDELKKAICPLRKIMDKYPGKLDELLTYASDPRLYLKAASIVWDLSRGYLRVMRSLLDYKLPWDFRSSVLPYGWGHALRSCPPFDEMLRDVRELEFASVGPLLFQYTHPDDFHNILQWLKTFPTPPHDLIIRFERHLEPCRRMIQRTTFDEFEYRWRSWRKRILGCSHSLPEVDYALTV
ncbi:hypothetical protein C8R44DRAFT_862213 [Mycena epipterygia]|nr:hypothetical protein C8R44DRAFT_862213 [Mycena epipterygia]